MPANLLDAYSIGGDSISAALAASETETALPPLELDTGNKLPRFVAVTVDGTETAFVRPAVAGTTAVTTITGMGISPNQRPVVLNVAGCDVLKHIGAVGSNVHITPLANQ